MFSISSPAIMGTLICINEITYLFLLPQYINLKSAREYLQVFVPIDLSFMQLSTPMFQQHLAEYCSILRRDFPNFTDTCSQWVLHDIEFIILFLAVLALLHYLQPADGRKGRLRQLFRYVHLKYKTFTIFYSITTGMEKLSKYMIIVFFVQINAYHKLLAIGITIGFVLSIGYALFALTNIVEDWSTTECEKERKDVVMNFDIALIFYNRRNERYLYSYIIVLIKNVLLLSLVVLLKRLPHLSLVLVIAIQSAATAFLAYISRRSFSRQQVFVVCSEFSVAFCYMLLYLNEGGVIKSQAGYRLIYNFFLCLSLLHSFYQFINDVIIVRLLPEKKDE